MFAGYAGWSAGQLGRELAEGAWACVDGAPARRAGGLRRARSCGESVLRRPVRSAGRAVDGAGRPVRELSRRPAAACRWPEPPGPGRKEPAGGGDLGKRPPPPVLSWGATSPSAPRDLRVGRGQVHGVRVGRQGDLPLAVVGQRDGDVEVLQLRDVLDQQLVLGRHRDLRAGAAAEHRGELTVHRLAARPGVLLEGPRVVGRPRGQPPDHLHQHVQQRGRARGVGGGDRALRVAWPAAGRGQRVRRARHVALPQVGLREEDRSGSPPAGRRRQW